MFEVLWASRITEGAGFWTYGPSMIADFLVTTRKELLVTKNLLKSSVVLGIMFGACAAAHGLAFGHGPEIDPSLAISAITLLAGSLAVLRVRHKK